MPLRDIVAAALSRPAGRVVEAPVRSIVNEVLTDHGYASPADLRSLEDRISALSKLVSALEARLGSAEQGADVLRAEVETLRGRLVAQATPEVAGAAPSTGGEPASGVGELGGDAMNRWKAGRLPGYVGPEGLIEIDGKPYRVDAAYAGRPFEISGTRVKRVRVDGAWVKKVAL